MKNSIIFSVFCFVLLGIAACNKDKVGKVPLPEGYYENQWEEAIQAAREQDKPVFIHFYAEWCSLCASFKEEVLNESEVETYMQSKFIGVLMDAEKDKGLERYEHYGLSGHPNFAVVDKDGNLIASHRGKMSKEDFLNWIKQYE